MSESSSNETIKKDAYISPCKKYRYWLSRKWNTDKGIILFIGLNPSTADDKRDDKTILRCIDFTRRWGYGGFYMVNLFALRSTYPRVLKKCADPQGEDNTKTIIALHILTDLTIAAWGTNGTLHNQDKMVKSLISPIYCMAKTKDGHPRHPLYLKSTCKPFLWSEF